MRAALTRQRKRSVRLALIPRLARFSLSAIESCREDIIEGPAASTLRLNAFAISVRHHPSERRFTLHWNRAPQKDALLPCTDAILQAGIRNVVVGAIDVNPRHSGKGIVQLRNAGVSVREGVLADDCAQINEAFNKWIVTERPFVIAKCGMSLDGRLTRPAGESRWITGRSARRHAHQLRAQVDAILVGAETVRSDNPRLTVRGVRGARQPWRVVLTRSGKLPRRAQLFSDGFSSRTLSLSTRVSGCRA